MSADTDVLAAITTRFLATKALTVAIPGGLWTDRVPADRKLPYAVARSERAQEPEYFSYQGSTDSYIDFRRVTMDIYGIGKAKVGGLIELFRATFDRQLFPTPARTRLMACLANGDIKTEADTTEKDGQDVFIGTLELLVTTERDMA